MKNLIIFVVLSIFSFSFATDDFTELNALGCVWTIPNTMNIHKNEQTKEINILSKIGSEGGVRGISISQNKSELKEYLISSEIEKTIIDQYNSNFNTYRLSSKKDKTVNGLRTVLYENNYSFALVMGFSDKDRYKLTQSCS